MKVLVLNSHALESLLDLDGLRHEMQQILQAMSSGEAQNFPRHVDVIAEGALGFMSATHAGKLGYKAVSVFKRNGEKNLNPHQGLVALLHPQTGTLQALLDGMTITALRTAAVSAAATDFLAHKTARHLALIGNGRQAYEHARALLKIRPLERISIYGRSAEKSELLIQNLRPFFSGEFLTTRSPQEAVRSAEIIVSATSSSSPLFSVLALEPGCHLNAVGACRPGSREIRLQSRSGLKIYMDSRMACGLEAEEIISALKDRSLSSSDIAGEIGSAFSGTIVGRQSENEITIFKSVGLGVQDLAAAYFFFQQAVEFSQGQLIEL